MTPVNLLPKEIYDLIVSSKARNLSGALRKIYGSPKTGKSRKTFIDKTNRVVIKLPMLDGYNRFNEQEYRNYIAYRKGELNTPIADCDLIYTSDNVAVIIMAIVKPLTAIYTYQLPDHFRGGTVDTYQIGYMDDGQLVSFDNTTGVL